MYRKKIIPIVLILLLTATIAVSIIAAKPKPPKTFKSKVTIVITDSPPEDAIIIGPVFEDGFWIVIHTPKFIIAIDPRRSGGPALPAYDEG
ncbi:MAG: hypothetical protein J7L38_07700 [Thermoproteales archaeon]|nr:hypothetical protein [Thermoproteales archaeon]